MAALYGRWANIRITQGKTDDDTLRFKVLIDGDEVGSKDIQPGRKFWKAHMYLGLLNDNHYPGRVANIYVNGERYT